MTSRRGRPLVPPIVLLGPPGAGKSTVGPRLADRLGWRCIDLDDRADAARFAELGEVRFRLREHLALQAALMEGAVVVVAGAGVVDLDDNRDLLQHALCLGIDVDTDTALARLRVQGARPWLPADDAASWPRIYAAREHHRPGWRRALAAATVDGTANLDVVAAALADAVDAWRPAVRPDPDVIDTDVMPTLLPAVRGGQRAFVVADAAVAGILAQHGVDIDLALTFTDADKRLGTVEHILGALVGAGITRHDVIVAVGGGLLGDVTGLAAALHHRGTPWWMVPTTLLAMVDAGLGGKTAVDVVVDGALVRNAAGRVHHAKGSVVWPGFLRTLGADAIRHGRAEMLKHALLAGLDLDEAIAVTPDAIARSRGYKRLVTDVDGPEAHLRHALNLGHTVGHALESHFGIPHGDAVLHGLRAALHLSRSLVGLGNADYVAAVAAVAAPGPPPLPHPGVRRDTVVAALMATLRRDKKSGRFVLLRAPGQPVFVDVTVADDDAVAAAIASLWDGGSGG